MLKEDTLESAQVDISLWRNQDQNENHGTHEVEILQTIVHVAEIMSTSRGSKDKRTQLLVSMGDLVARVARRIPTKLSPNVLTSLCKFYAQHLETGQLHLVQELMDFHAARVNPRNLVVPYHFFHTLVAEE